MYFKSLLLSSLLFPTFAFAHGADEALSADNLSSGIIEPCLAMADTSSRNACYDTLCRFDKECGKLLLQAAVIDAGPETGFKVLHDLVDRGDRAVTGDGHDFAHVIGRETARTFGPVWDAFSRCPNDFFLGCQHGFFEEMLITHPDAAEAAVLICKTAPLDAASYCYHGIGHGLLMAKDYDTKAALAACDQLPRASNQRSCFTGVFMENVNAHFQGFARIGQFSKDDLFSPCDHVAERYQQGCYEQQADYLYRASSGSIIAVASACDGIKDVYSRTGCVRHLGQNVATAEFQDHFLGSFDVAHGLSLAATPCWFSRRWF